MLNSKRGSVFAEAAIIIPLVVLIIAGMIRVSFSLMDRVQEKSEAVKNENKEYMENETLTTEDIFRAKWLLQ